MLTYGVKEVYSKGFISVSQNDTLSQCLSLLKKKKPPVLAVLDKKGNYKGILARRWIIRSRLDPSTTKVKTLMRPAPKVEESFSLSKVAKLMIESEIRQLPVYRGKKLLGFITDEDIIQKIVMERWGDTKIEDIMTKKPFTIEENETIGGVLNLFREQGISHAPVVRDGKLVGIISIRDIIENIYKPKERISVDARKEKIRPLNTPIKRLMIKSVMTILPNDRLKSAEERMREFDISSLVIIKEGRPIGIITKRDFLEPIAQMDKKVPELTIQFSVKDFKIDPLKRDYIIDEFDSFSKRHRESLESGTLFVYMKTHGTNYKGKKLIHCRLQLKTRKGSFFSSSEGWRIEENFRIALDRLERQILKSADITYDPEIADNYLQLIDFPLTEL